MQKIWSLHKTWKLIRKQQHLEWWTRLGNCEEVLFNEWLNGSTFSMRADVSQQIFSQLMSRRVNNNKTVSKSIWRHEHAFIFHSHHQNSNSRREIFASASYGLLTTLRRICAWGTCIRYKKKSLQQFFVCTSTVTHAEYAGQKCQADVLKSTFSANAVSVLLHERAHLWP